MPKVRLNAKKFRNSMFTQAYQQPAVIMQCRVINTNMVNWTVDVVSQFDRHYFSDIQVLSPYLHYDNGEGIYVMPEVGAVCMVCIPSDTTAPFVAGYVAPMEQPAAEQLQNPNDPSSATTTSVVGTQTIDPSQTTGSDAPNGTRSRGSNTVQYPASDAAFSAGRPAYNPGDIVMRTRDDNFVILHRGGVVSIGSTELAQRIYIPLGNKILDISGDYEHQNIGGSVSWGMQQGPQVDNPAVQNMETFRIFANDQYADIRVARGKVLNPIGEPNGDAGDTDDIANYNLGDQSDSGIICYEVAVAQTQTAGNGGFQAVSGDPSDNNVQQQQVLRFFFDANGGVFLRAAGNALFSFHQSLKIKVSDEFTLEADTVTIAASDSATLGGVNLTEISGNLVKFDAGEGLPAARQGDIVTIAPPPGCTISGTLSCPAMGIPPPGQPVTLTIVSITPPLTGNITTGNPDIQM